MNMRNVGSNLSFFLRTLVALATVLHVLVGCSSAATSGAPSIGTQPSAATVADGALASFAVVAAGDPTLAYQWRRDGVDLADGPGISGATTAALALTAQLAWTGSQISVRVSNAGGEALSDDALLTVTTAAGGPGPGPGPTDGSGKTWGPPALVSTGAVDGQPERADVAIDGKGDAIAVWVEKKGSRRALHANLCPAGKAWGVASTIDDDGGNSGDPRIAIAPSGSAVVAFSHTTETTGGLMRTWATRFTGAWGASKAVDGANGSPSEEARVAVAADGATLVAFVQPDGAFPRVQATSSTLSTPWTTPTALDVAGGAFPEVVIAANGHAVTTWVKPQGPAGDALWASRTTGSGWAPATPIAPETGKVGRSIRLAVDASGNTVAVWTQYVSGRYTVRASRLDDTTGAWSTAVSLSSGERDASGEDVAADAKGNAVVVWHEDAAGVFASRFTAATAAWSAPVNIGPKATPPSISSQPRVGVDASGNAVAVWLQVPAGMAGKRVHAAHLASGAGTWGAPIDLMTEAGAYTTDAAKVAVNADGQATVVWYQMVDAPPAAGIWARSYR